MPSSGGESTRLILADTFSSFGTHRFSDVTTHSNHRLSCSSSKNLSAKSKRSQPFDANGEHSDGSFVRDSTTQGLRTLETERGGILRTTKGSSKHKRVVMIEDNMTEMPASSPQLHDQFHSENLAVSSYHRPGATRESAGSFVDTGVDRGTSAALVFFTNVPCLVQDAHDRFNKIQSSIREMAPRAHVYGFAEASRVSHDATYRGIIQVVPMYTMRQISHTRLVPTGKLQETFDQRWFMYVFLFSVMLTFALVAAVAYGQELFFLLIYVAAGFQAVCTVLWAIHLSRPLLVLLIQTFDFWLVMAWSSLACYCITHNSDRSDQFAVIEACLFFAVQLVVLLFDAYSVPSRVEKTILYLLNCSNIFRYLVQWSIYFYTSTNFRIVNFLGGDVPLAMIGHATFLALLSFHLRFAYRCWYRKLDMVVLEFPANIVPHAVFLDDNGEAADEGVTSPQVMVSKSLATFTRESVVQKIKESEERRRSTYLQDVSVNSKQDQTKQDQSDESFEGDSDDHSDERRHAQPDPTTRRDDDNHHVVLHVDGAIPLLHPEIEEELMLSSIEAAISPGGVMESHSIENSYAFTDYCRTLLPVVYMLSYSPTPMWRWRRAYEYAASNPRFPWLLLGFLALTIVCEAVIRFSGCGSSWIWVLVLMRLLWVTYLLIHLMCFVSQSLAKAALKTLDFWYVIFIFGLENASWMILRSKGTYNDATTTIVYIGVTGLMSSLLSLYFAFLDCISVPTFTPTFKGVCGFAMLLFEMEALLSSEFGKDPERYTTSSESIVDLYVTVVSTPGWRFYYLALIILFLKVAVRTLWMKTSLVFLQLGVVEERFGQNAALQIDS